VSGEGALAQTVGQEGTVPRVARHSLFFQRMSALLLAIVCAGFARTLFLRPVFQVPPIPWYLYVHGIVLTAWFALLVVQTSLIAARRTDLHRRLGIAGAILAVAVVGTGLVAILGMPHRLRSLDLATKALTVWTSFAFIAAFSILVTAALSLRRRPEAHRRLMLLASLAIIGPALGRIGLLLSQAGVPPTLALIAVNILVWVGLPVMLMVHDRRVARRLHPATIWGTTVFFVLLIGSIAVSNSGVGRALVKALE